MSHRAESPVTVAIPPRIARWLLAAVVVLIVYGSLFPFRFAADDRSLLRILLDLPLRPTSRGDIVANLLLYAPFGLCLSLLLIARKGRIAALAGATIAGTALSLCIEVLQAHDAGRVSSLTDVVLNAIGSLLGAAAGAVYAQRMQTLRVAGFAAGAAEPTPLVVVGLWLAFRLAPFLPTIDWQKFKDALKPLLIQPTIRPLDVFSYGVGWLIVGYSLRRLSRSPRAWTAFLGIAAAVFLGRVVIVDTAVSPSEAVGLVIFAPFVLLLGDARRPITLAAAAAMAVLLQGLAPFSFAADAHPFSWVPFMNALTGDMEFGYVVLFEKTFWYVALLWLLARALSSPTAATVLTVALLASIEVAQLWLPGRSPEITDPLLALGLAWALRTVPSGTPRSR